MQNSKVFTILALTLFLSGAFARGDGGNHKRLSAYGSYGLVAVSPTDANNLLTSTLLTPTLSKITSDTVITGGLTFMLNPKFAVFAEYDSQTASSKGNTTSPSGTSGVEMFANSIWAGVNFYIISRDRAALFVGAGGGVPLYLHERVTLGGTPSDYDGTKSVNFKAQVGLDVYIIRMLALEILGGYQSLTSNSLTNSSGQNLNTAGTTVAGTNAKFDLSGAFGRAGLRFMF
jgi:outer membrane protein W